jgi:hypothetical protein
MARKQGKAVTVKIDRSGFAATETFMSKADADAWQEMVETTLEHREKVTFDLSVYAAGLAATVRAHGGAYTKDKWLNVEVPHEQWCKGLPCELDYEAMFKDVLAGRPLKPTRDYQ